MIVLNGVLLFLIFCTTVNAYQVNLTCDSPIVWGAPSNCSVTVYNDDNVPDDGKFGYNWVNDFIPHDSREVNTGPSTDSWLVTYNTSINLPGLYVTRLDVCVWEFLGIYCKPLGSVGITIKITDTLNGKLISSQSDKERDKFISSEDPLQSSVELKESDKNFLSKAPTVLSYWFVDCIYYGITSDLQFDYNFTKPDEQHVIEALVVADFTPLPPPTTTTTTQKPTTSPNVTTTTSTTTTHKPKPTNGTTIIPKTSVKSTVRHKREILTSPAPTLVGTNNSSTIRIWQNGTLVPYNGTFPYVCNSTFVVTDHKKVYGYFSKTVTTKAPITKVNVSGTNWLKHEQLLNLNVKCSGSGQLKYCLKFIPGIYNVTGNETCETYDDLNECNFNIERYFHGAEKHTVLIIIKNDVSIKVTSVTVTVYKVKQQAQLSVIVVPVVFSLVAIVTVIFGVAYYLQNRSRIIVEVANFDFGKQYSDMEYKTFKDRLKDSIANAFSQPSTSSESQDWSSGHKYGSMT
ncbi:uncharacterized protein LOC115877286 [Sitophilus oryzae]|uniref:Uncharacterized protein LOC115877286 n=1 Tax=Sitophilus oryzae TaxID=7048 RepID=A0A6J2XDG7_SITOR|nr:uncharacterized protein LOC115877286 [Sitophilus oryzae]